MHEPYPFDDGFQVALCGLLTADLTWARRMVPLLRADGFSVPEVRTWVELSQQYLQDYHAAPTLVELRQCGHQVHVDGRLSMAKLSVLGQLLDQLEYAGRKNPAQSMGREFAEKSLLLEIRRERFTGALDGVMKLAREDCFEEAAQSLVDSLRGLGTDPYDPEKPGLILRKDGLLADGEEEGDEDALASVRHPTGIADLDSVMEGGLAAGELGVLMGLPKQGKSQGLLRIALTETRHGRVVVYYTMELSRRAVAARTVAALRNRPINSAWRLPTPKLLRLAGKAAGKYGGVLVVKKFPSGRADTRDIRKHLRVLARSWSLVPSMIIVDYVDITAPTTGEGGGLYEAGGQVCQDLKELAEEYRVPVWTASQAVRGGTEKELIGIGDVAHSFKKIHILDVMISINRTPDEVAAHQVRLFLAASRFCEDGVELGPYTTAYANARFLEEGWET